MTEEEVSVIFSDNGDDLSQLVGITDNDISIEDVIGQRSPSVRVNNYIFSIVSDEYDLMESIQEKETNQNEQETEKQKISGTVGVSALPEILPRPLTSEFRPNVYSNVPKPKRKQKRGSYICKSCGAEKKDHVCNAITCYDQEIQTIAR